jgi:hypothetical protein
LLLLELLLLLSKIIKLPLYKYGDGRLQAKL